MEKLFVSYLFIAFFLTVNSLTAECQITRKNWFVGGTGKFYSYATQHTSSTHSNEGKYTKIDLSPAIGYFFMDKLALGVRPTFSSHKGEVTIPGGGSTNMQRYWIGPFGRYYFLQPDKLVNILTDISYQYGFYGGTAYGKLNTFSAMVGTVVYFNSCVGIEFLLGYSSSLENIEGFREDAEDFLKETRKGFQMGIGFQIHLEK